jgi:hypothetical protein
MQPQIKVRQTPAWLRAYSVVLGFLRDQHADQTQLTIDMEFAQSRQRPSVSKPDGDDASDDDFDELLRSIPDEDEASFESRVRSYVGRSHALSIDDSLKGAFLTQPPSSATGRPAFLTDAARPSEPPVAKPPSHVSSNSDDALDIQFDDGDDHEEPPVKLSPPFTGSARHTFSSDIEFANESDQSDSDAPPTTGQPSRSNNNGSPKPGAGNVQREESMDFDDIRDIGIDIDSDS